MRGYEWLLLVVVVVVAGCDDGGGSAGDAGGPGALDAQRADAALRDGPDAARGEADATPRPRDDAGGSPPDGSPPDGSPPDGSPPDASPSDAGPLDAAPPVPDAAPPDAAPPDAAPLDAAPPLDGTPPDAPPSDAVPLPDAAPPDAAPPPDAALPDAAPLPLDAAPPDAEPLPDGAVAVIDAAPWPDPRPPPLLPPLITEIAARGILLDEDGQPTDWIEIHNPNGAPFDLGGWHLANAPDRLDRWTFPAGTALPPGGYLLVYASGKDRRAAGQPLHTSFRLAGDDDYLALVTPGGEVAHAVNGWPPQIEGASWGFLTHVTTTPLAGPGDPVRWAVPTAEDGLDAVWTDPDLDDGAPPWVPGAGGLGFDHAPPPRAPVHLTDSVTAFSGAQGRGGWWYGYWDAAADDDGLYAPDTELTPFPEDHWDGTRWRLSAGEPPWTELNATGGRPNGSEDGGVRWAVRRWVSTVDGPVRITGTLSNPSLDGDGVTARILVDGDAVMGRTINGGRVDYEVATYVSAGSLVDFVLDPGPAGDARGDGASFTGRIERPGEAIEGVGPRVADSVADWSAEGRQGAAGWSYGWYDYAADPDGTFAPDDFQPFPSDGGPWSPTNFWSGASWDWFEGDGSGIGIGRERMQPSGASQGTERWPVRRWTSTREGTLVVRWHLAKLDPEGSGVTGRLFVEGRPVDAVTIAGNDVGGAVRTVVLAGVRPGDHLDFVVDPAGPEGDPDDAGDAALLTASVFAPPDLAPLLATDVGPADGLWVRLPFFVRDPARVESLRLTMRYDDGFAAWLNGSLVAADGAPEPPAPGARALADRPAGAAFVPVDFDLPAPGALLRPGLNVLAVQAFDGPAEDHRLLVEPAISVVERVIDTSRARYLPVPTPGADNVLGGELGPLVHGVTRDIAAAHGERLVIEADVYETAAPIADVTLTWRVRFGPEASVAMTRVGANRYRATLPVEATTPGELLRWAVSATDARGASTRAPAFADPLDSEQYYGTVVEDPEIQSDLPVLHWFVERPDLANNNTGARSTLWFDGELYDNVFIDLHGQSTRGFPKKSHDADLPRDHRFRLRDDLLRMKDFNLLTNYADKSKLRNTLGYEAFRRAGHEHHLALPVRVHRNGQFYAVYDFVEDPDDRFLRRLGVPEPVGALYKMYDRLQNANAGEKKTRKDEGNGDLQALIAGLALDAQSRRAFVFDNVNLARMANYLAVMFVIQNVDCCHKNYYVYRDSDRTDEWWFFPWDVDLSFGRVWTGSYFDDTMYFDRPLYLGRNVGAVNTLLTALYALPEFDEMYLRRVRTLVDTWLMPSEGDASFEQLIDELVARMQRDADQDNAAWPTWGQRQTFLEGVDQLVTGYLQRRRQFISERLTVPPGEVDVLLWGEEPVRWRVPLDDDPAWIAPDFDDAGWAEGQQGLGYEDGPAHYAAVLSTEVRPQDLDPAASSVQVRATFLLDDPAAVARPTLRVRYDDGFVAWLNGVEVARRNVQGAPRWDGVAAERADVAGVRYEDINLTAHRPLLVPGENVLAVQVQNGPADDLLLFFELVDGVPGGGGPLPPAQAPHVLVEITAQDAAPGAPGEAYVLVANRGEAAVDVSGWRLAGAGIEHVFHPGTVLPARGLLHVVGDARAFRRRFGGRALFVQGNWRGALRAGEAPAVYDDQGTPRSP